MPEILPEHVPSPRTPLVWDGARYRAIRSHTDGTVQVRGEDQVFSYNVRLFRWGRLSVHAGGRQELNSDPVTAGQVWVVTSVCARNYTAAATAIELAVIVGGVSYTLTVRAHTVAGLTVDWHGVLTLENPDFIRVIFTASGANDILDLWFCGYSMTLET